jgi:hypothetical protein
VHQHPVPVPVISLEGEVLGSSLRHTLPPMRRVSGGRFMQAMALLYGPAGESETRVTRQREVRAVSNHFVQALPRRVSALYLARKKRCRQSVAARQEIEERNRVPKKRAIPPPCEMAPITVPRLARHDETRAPAG